MTKINQVTSNILILTAIIATFSTNSIFSMSLLKAIRDNNPGIVEKILSKPRPGFDINQQITTSDPKNPNSGSLICQSPIYLACELGNLEIANILYKKGAKLNDIILYGSNKGATALSVACDKKHFEMVRFLVSKGADIDYRIPAPECPSLKTKYISILELMATKALMPNQFTDALDNGILLSPQECYRLIAAQRESNVKNIHLDIMQFLLQNNARVAESLFYFNRISDIDKRNSKYFGLVAELNGKIDKNEDIKTLVFGKLNEETLDSFLFLVKLTFGKALCELRNGKSIESTPFYDIYFILKKAKLLSLIFGTPRELEEKNVYKFVKEAAKQNSYFLDEKLIDKLISSEKITE